MTSLLRMKKKKQYGRQIDPFSFLSSPLLTIVEHLFRQTNILVAKGLYKVCRVSLQILICNIGQFTLKFNCPLVIKME